MGRSLHKLTAIQAAKLKVPGRHSDGGGLYLSIDDSGRRRWVFIYTRGAKRTELGLGGGRDLTLANARVEAAAFRNILAEGVNGGAKVGQWGGVKTGQVSGLLRPSSGDARSHA